MESDSYNDNLQGYNVEAMLRIQCDDGYTIDGGGSIELTCNTTSKWIFTDVHGLPKEWDSAKKCTHKHTCPVPPNMKVTNGGIYKDKTIYHNEQREFQCQETFQLFENNINIQSETKKVNGTCGKSLLPDYFCGYEAMILIKVQAEYREIEGRTSFLFGTRCIENTDSFITELENRLSKKMEDHYDIKTPAISHRIRGTGVNDTHYSYIILRLAIKPSVNFDNKADSLTNFTEELKDIKNDIKLEFEDCIVDIKDIQVIAEGFCPDLDITNSKGKYTWKNIKKDQSNDEECAQDKEKKATVECNSSDCVEGAGCWFPNTNYDECPFMNEKTRVINDIKNNESLTAENKADELKRVTEDMTAEDITEDTYNMGADTIVDIMSNKTDDNKGGISEKILEVIDKFASVEKSTAFKDSNATSRYLQALDQVVADLPVEAGSKEAKKKLKNMKLTVKELRKDNEKYIKLSSKGSDISIASANNGDQSIIEDRVDDIVMTIPPGINERINTDTDDNRFYFIVFDTPTFFTTEDIYTEQKTLQSKVFSAGISGQNSIRRIKPPIKFMIRLSDNSTNNKSDCVYWEDDKNLPPTERKIEKVETIATSKDFVECRTNHLTSFAVLMTSEPLPEIHDQILTAASYIGGSLSIIGLTMSLIGLAVFRQIRQPLGTKVHINMAAALLAGLLVFTIGVNHADTTGKDSTRKWTCFAIGVAIHYFLLAAIFWMGIEGFYLYIKIVRVFGNQSYRFLLKCALFAWGFPLLIVAGTVGWSIDNYETQKFCWLAKEPMIAMFMTPVMIVVLINTYMFIRVVNEINKSQNRLKADNMPSNCAKSIDLKEKVIKVRAAISIMVLLGLTWIIGPFLLLDVKGLKEALSYVFVVCTSLQGFFFFFFHCAIKTDVKERWKTYLGIEVSSHSKLTDFSKTYSNQMPKSKQVNKTTEFSKLGDSASSLNKSLISFKPKNKIRPGSPDDDSDLAVVEF